MHLILYITNEIFTEPYSCLGCLYGSYPAAQKFTSECWVLVYSLSIDDGVGWLLHTAIPILHPSIALLCLSQGSLAAAEVSVLIRLLIFIVRSRGHVHVHLVLSWVTLFQLEAPMTPAEKRQKAFCDQLIQTWGILKITLPLNYRFKYYQGWLPLQLCG